MNILFVMYDQLRFDYLGCTGRPHLKTPNFDRVAAMDVRFSNAYVQSPVCGGSRMCYYTGRYAASHSALWNGFPLRMGELTLPANIREEDSETPWLTSQALDFIDKTPGPWCAHLS